jgi:drug/metabolite transporter (DMT)-like permease
MRPESGYRVPMDHATLGRARGTPALGHLALLGVQLCFGLFPIFGKLAMRSFDPRAIVTWRIVAGSVVLLALAFLRHGRAAFPRPGDLPRLLAAALLGVPINMVLFLEGLERSTTINAACLMPAIPVYTLVIAVLVGQERFDARRAAGIGLALAGTLVLLLQKGPEFGAEHLEGNLLFVLNTASYALYLVISKPLLARYPAPVLIAWVFALSLWTIPFFHDGSALVPSAASTADWLSLGYILVFATGAAYLLNAFALSVVSASTTATYILLQPLITAAAGVLVLGERVGPRTGIAAAGILAGVWLVVKAPARRGPLAVADGG